MTKTAKLSFFDNYHLQSVSIEQAQVLSKAQGNFLEQTMKEVSRCLLRDQYNSKETVIAQRYQQHRRLISMGEALEKPVQFINSQLRLYELIHSSQLKDAQKLSWEFLLGLSRYALGLQIAQIFLYEKFKDHDVAVNISVNSDSAYAIDELLSLTSEIKPLSHRMVSYYLEQPQNNYWLDIHEFFSCHPKLEQLAKQIISLQYIPPDVRFMSMAQTLHWNGFGGTGDILLEYPPLDQFAAYCLRVHATPSGKNEQSYGGLAILNSGFNKLRYYQQQIAINLLSHIPSDKTIRIYDLCAGPQYAAVKPIVEALPHRRIELSVSDIDGTSIQALHKAHYPSQCYLNKVSYIDLNLPLTASAAEKDSYDLIILNMALHQVSDNSIYAALRYCAELLKPDCCMLNIDNIKDCYPQLVAIPENAVDREGGIIQEDELDLMKLSCQQGDHVKFMYPIKEIVNRALGPTSRIDSNNYPLGPYTLRVYVAMVLPKEIFLQLVTAWQKQDDEQCQLLVPESKALKILQA